MTPVERLKKRFYGDFKPTKSMYYETVREAVDPAMSVLDFGAGRGVSYVFDKGEVAKVCGVDVDKGILENTRLDEKHVIVDEYLPFEDASIDVAYSTYVAEHLIDPVDSLKEINRILKPGGKFIFLTISRFHYVALIARITPLRFHEFLMNRIRKRAVEDVFPTAYKLNSRRQIYDVARCTGFDVVRIVHRESPPNYLVFNVLAFAMGILYEKTVRNLPFLRQLRSGLIVVLQKQSNRPDE